MNQRTVDEALQPVVLSRFQQGQLVEYDDVCVNEAPLEIRLRICKKGQGIDATTQSLMCTMRTPGNDIALVKGLLLTSGVISDLNNIADIRELVDEQSQTFANVVVVTLFELADINIQRISRGMQANSSCGICGQHYIDNLYQQRSDSQLNSEITINPVQVSTLINALEIQQSLFRRTGGCHGVGLFNRHAELLDVQEDIGRHNAMDKIIGHNAPLLVGSTQPYGVVISSRASYEILQKAAMLHLQIVIAVGAPSSLAIEVAKEMDITLIAFVRNDEFNVYSGQQRLQVEQNSV